MHRSGTSLTAKWLSSCGLSLGDRLMKGAIGNNEGHYEDLDFYDFHEDVFRESEIPYGGLIRTEAIQLSTYFQARLESMIGFKNGLRSHWGWKDPRTCLFLNHYPQRLRNPRYLILHRPADQVINSLWKRQVQISQIETAMDSPEQAELMNGFIESWIQYNEKILTLKDGLKPAEYRIHTVHDLLHEGGAVIDWLNEAGFGLAKVSFGEIFDPQKFTYEVERPPYSPDQEARIKTIEERFAMMRSEKGYAAELEANLSLKNRRICALEAELKKDNEYMPEERAKLRTKVGDLERALEHKNQLVLSAQQWQRNWLRRTLHKWRPS